MAERRLHTQFMSDKGKSLWLLGAMTIVILSIAAMYIGNTTKKPGRANTLSGGTTAEETKEGYDTTLFGVVKEVDEIESTVTVYDIEAGIDRTLTYTGGTRIIDRYDKEKTMGWLPIGELVDVYYYQASYKAVRVEVNKEAWEYSGINRFQFDMTKQRVTIANTLYSYDRDIFVTGAGQELGIIDINGRDELMMKGVGKQVYSVIITKGHGYIRLANYDAFLGGTIEIGYGIMLPVVEDMLIAAREGTYKIVMEKGELSGSKEVTIERDQEYILDMSGFRVAEDRTANAVFMIDPEGAKLYINGIDTDYSRKVKLNYGDYQLRVEMEGYADFDGTLTIEEKSPVICISLSVDGADTSGTTDGTTITPSEEETGSTDTDTEEEDSNQSSSQDTDTEEKDTEDESTDSETDSTKEDSTEDESDNSTVNSVGTTLIDEDHVITISAPEGAKVYWNGAYKGTVPVTFAKEIGNHVITFSQTGYLTRSYSCEITDDANDVTLNFPDMVKKETN